MLFPAIRKLWRPGFAGIAKPSENLPDAAPCRKNSFRSRISGLKQPHKQSALPQLPQPFASNYHRRPVGEIIGICSADNAVRRKTGRFSLKPVYMAVKQL